MKEMSKSMNEELKRVLQTKINDASRGQFTVEGAVIRNVYLDGEKRQVLNKDGSVAFVTNARGFDLVLTEDQAQNFIDIGCQMTSVHYDVPECNVYFMPLIVSDNAEIIRVDNNGKTKTKLVPADKLEMKKLQDSASLFSNVDLLISPWTKSTSKKGYPTYVNFAGFTITSVAANLMSKYMDDEPFPVAGGPVYSEEEDLPF